MTEQKTEKKERQLFFARLEPTNLNKKDRILLRRCVGRSIEEVGTSAWGAFYKNVPFNFSEEDEKKAFFVEQGKNGTSSLPEAWARYSARKECGDERVLHLLDRSWNKATALSVIKTARLLMREGYSIDMERLFTDIKFWGSAITKRNWAKAIAKTKEEN